MLEKRNLLSQAAKLIGLDRRALKRWRLTDIRKRKATNEQ
jgi:hypothetical protein